MTRESPPHHECPHTAAQLNWSNKIALSRAEILAALKERGMEPESAYEPLTQVRV
jgi:hypothetical protein